MLPPGHFAAGYLVAKGLLAVTKPTLTPVQTDWLLFLGGFFGFMPDLDMFYAFWKEGGLHHTGKTFNHRGFITHTPIVWLVIGLVVAGLAPSTFVRYIGILLWLGPWSHFLLDSTDTGVRWLYPLSTKFYALKNPGRSEPNETTGFFNHWWSLVKQYHRHVPLTAYTEIILVIVALVVFLR